MTYRQIENYLDGYFDASNFNLFWEYHGGFDSDEHTFHILNEYFYEASKALEFKIPAPKKQSNNNWNDIEDFADTFCDVTLRELLNNKKIEIKYEVNTPCPECSSYQDKFKNIHKNYDYDNDRYKDINYYKLGNLFVKIKWNNKNANNCSICKGTSQVQTKLKKEVEIDSEYFNETPVEFESQGGKHALNQSNSKLKVLFNIIPDKDVETDGKNIFIRRDITIAKAFFGGKERVKYFGKEVEVDIPPAEQWESDTQCQVILKNKGIPIKSLEECGDLIITFIPRISKCESNDLYHLYSCLKNEEGILKNKKNINQKDSTETKEDFYKIEMQKLWNKKNKRKK
jgi:DnaJ-class molecular chaperone